MQSLNREVTEKKEYIFQDYISRTKGRKGLLDVTMSARPFRRLNYETQKSRNLASPLRDQLVGTKKRSDEEKSRSVMLTQQFFLHFLSLEGGNSRTYKNNFQSNSNKKKYCAEQVQGESQSELWDKRWIGSRTKTVRSFHKQNSKILVLLLGDTG